MITIPTTSFSWKDFVEGVKFFQSIPPPEKSLENTEKQEKELKSTVEQLRSKLKDLTEERQEITDLINDYSVKLETLEAELLMLSEEKHMLESIVVEDDDSFLDNLPYFYESVKKSADLKLKDVKEVTLLIKKQKRHLEICMNCEKKIKDEKGRKASIKHYHFENDKFDSYENEEFIYDPIICEECLESKEFKNSLNTIAEIVSCACNNPIVTCSKGSKEFGYLISEDCKDSFLYEFSKTFENFKTKLKELDRVKSIETLMIKRDNLV
jgi:hypothetical protein